jgi:hypothetical protein
MLKNSLSFLAGAFVISGAVFVAGGRPVQMFALGASVLALAFAIAFYAIGLERNGRFLLALNSALQAHSVRQSSRQSASVDPIEQDVVSALVHQGVPRRIARKAVIRAAAAANTSEFEPLFRLSVDAPRGAA